MDVGGSGGYYGWTYDYDKVYQVTDANEMLSTPRQLDIRYDAVYNRTSWNDSLTGLSMAYQDTALNQYSQMVYNGTPRTLTYDSRGNCTSFTGTVLGYDCENRRGWVRGKYTKSWKEVDISNPVWAY